MTAPNGVTIPDNVISRLKKLLQTANYSKEGDGQITEAEAELAMGRAQRLLAEYNVEAATIEAMADPSLPPEEKRVKEEHDKLATQKWQVRLWSTVANCNFCLHLTTAVYKQYKTPDPHQIALGYYPSECDQIWVERKIGDKHYLIGRESNVLATKLMAGYLESMINSLNPYKVERRDKALSWKEGCTERVRARLLDRKHEMIQEKPQAAPGPGCTAIALRTVYQSEYDKNIDAEWGAGTADKWRADREQKREEMAREDERREMVLDHPECFSREEYNAAVQHVARLRREAEKSEKRSQRESDRYWDGKNLAAWYEGQRAGESIGLDPQMSSSNARMLED